MNTNILIFIFLKTCFNLKKCYPIGMQKQKCECCNCSYSHNFISPITQKYISIKEIVNKKLPSAPVLQSLEPASKTIALFKKNKTKNIAINNYVNANSSERDNNYGFAPEGVKMKAEAIVLDETANTSPVNLNETESKKSDKSSIMLTTKSAPLPKSSKDNSNIMSAKKNQTVNKFIGTATAEPRDNCQPGRGLLHYRKWWERTKADISVNGQFITGIPIFIEENTLRVINKEYSYFIPLEKVDYIRTPDGLNSCCDSED